MMAKRIHTGIGKIFIVGNNGGFIFLSPVIEETVGTALKTEFVDVLNFLNQLATTRGTF